MTSPLESRAQWGTEQKLKQQALQLKQWEAVLKPEWYAKLKAEVEVTQKRDNEIVRGQAIDAIIMTMAANLFK